MIPVHCFFPADRKKYPCELCGKLLATLQAFKTHKKTHLGMLKKPPESNLLILSNSTYVFK